MTKVLKGAIFGAFFCFCLSAQITPFPPTPSGGGGLGAANCSTFAPSAGAVSPTFSGSQNCAYIPISSGATLTVTLPTASGVSGGFYLELRNSTNSNVTLTYAGATEVGLGTCITGGVANEITVIQMLWDNANTQWIPPSQNDPSVGALSSGQIYAAASCGPPVAATASNVVGLFSGGHSSSSYYLATDGSQQLAGGASGIYQTRLGAQAGVVLSGNTDTTLAQSNVITSGTMGNGGCYEYDIKLDISPTATNPVTLKVWLGSAATTGTALSVGNLSASPIWVQGTVCNHSGSATAQTMTYFLQFQQSTGGFAGETTAAFNTGTTNAVISVSGAASAGETVTVWEFVVKPLFPVI